MLRRAADHEIVSVHVQLIIQVGFFSLVILALGNTPFGQQSVSSGTVLTYFTCDHTTTQGRFLAERTLIVAA